MEGRTNRSVTQFSQPDHTHQSASTANSSTSVREASGAAVHSKSVDDDEPILARDKRVRALRLTLCEYALALPLHQVKFWEAWSYSDWATPIRNSTILWIQANPLTISKIFSARWTPNTKNIFGSTESTVESVPNRQLNPVELTIVESSRVDDCQNFTAGWTQNAMLITYKFCWTL